MAEVVYPTDADYPEPWLLDRNTLEEFDRLIDDGSERLGRAARERFSKQVDDAVSEYEETHKDEDQIKSYRKRMEQRYAGMQTSRRRLVVEFGDSKSVEAKSFSEVMKDHRVSEDAPTGFVMLLEHGDVESNIVLGKYGLRLRVSPRGDKVASDFFGGVNDWARRHQAPRWQVAWRKWAGFHWLIVILAMMIPVTIVGSNNNRGTKQQAHELLAHGLQPSDEHRALELTLRLVSEMDESSTPVPTWFWWTLGVAFILGLVMSGPPPAVIIAIGNGEARLRRWKRWLRFISYGVPIFLITTVVGFYIRELLPSLRAGVTSLPTP